MSTFDPGETLRWLDLAYPLHPERDERLHIAILPATGVAWTGRNLRRDQVATYAAQADQRQPQGIYLGACTYSPDVGNHRSAADTAYCYGLWSDVDFVSPARKYDPAQHGGLVLPADVDAGLALVAVSGLPQPSVILDSGWGLYAWWLFHQPVLAAECADLATAVQHVLAASALRFGWHYGTGVGDLARVLRLPGSINRKMPGDPRPCRILTDDGPHHNIDDLRGIVAGLTPPPPQAKPKTQPAPARPDAGAGAPRSGLSPLDDFNARATWADILTPHGWTHEYHHDEGYDAWRHPQATSPKSATTNHGGTDMLKCFSDNAGLPQKGTLTKAFVWAALRQGTDNPDMTTAARELAQAGYGTPVDHAAQTRQLIAAICGDDAIPSEPKPKTSTVNVDGLGADLSDSVMAQHIARDVLKGQFVWAKGLGWLAWNKQRWQECSDETVAEPVRQWAINRFAQVAKTGNPELIAMWRPILSLAKQRAALTLAKGITERHVADFDAHPDLINTPGGVVDMRTGQVTPHDATMLMTKITSGSYRPGYTHLDWEAALKALPDEPTRAWFAARIGQGATGHRTPDGVNIIMQGSGENGKGSLGADGLAPALGDYATVASQKLIADSREHSEEQATLRGKRLIIAEELTENKALNTTAIKRISDVAYITARHVHQKNMTFKVTHTLVATTNYVPVVNEVDHGTWRRLAMLRFPYTFRKPHQPLERPSDRRGDPGLKTRIENNVSGQHDAIVTWVIEGAIRWYNDGADALAPPPHVVEATAAWRATADRIAGFWQEMLIHDRGSCVLATHMLVVFNDWLKSNSHHQWSKELFAPRFATHSETTRHGVEHRRERRPEGISRWVGSAFLADPTVVSQAQVWRGVRFRTASDQDKHDPCAECADLKTTFLGDPHAGKVVNGSARSAQSMAGTDDGQPTASDDGQSAEARGPVDATPTQDPTCIVCHRPLKPEYRPEWHALSTCPPCGVAAGIRPDDIGGHQTPQPQDH